MMLWRISLLPLAPAPAAMNTPFTLPPILFFSITLPLLVPTNPIPKLSGVPLARVERAEPLPSRKFNRTRLLWLFVSQVPPQGKLLEPSAFRTETFPSMSLSVVPTRKIPLKQLSDVVTP